MERRDATLDATCVQVFGKISAAISHDLKNVLAIVNENAGLLDDLALRAAKGIEIPPERLSIATARILKQVKRGDTVLKNLNRYAHSTDLPVQQLNVAEMVALMVDLAGRQAAMKEVSFTITPAEVQVTTCAIYLESLVYLVLRQVIDTLPRREAVEVAVLEEGGMACLCLRSGSELALLPAEGYPAAQEEELLRWLGATLIMAPGSVELRLPQQSGH